MKYLIARSAAGCLVLAGAGLILGRFTPAGAQDYQLRGGPAAYQALNAPRSEVSRELEALYRKNGRQMPDMNLDTMPVQSDAQAHVPGSRNPVSGITAPQGGVTLAPSKPGLLQRIFGNRSSRPAKAPATSRRAARPGTATMAPQRAGTHYFAGSSRPAGAPQAGAAAPPPTPGAAPASPAPAVSRPNIITPPLAPVEPAPLGGALREPAAVAGSDEPLTSRRTSKGAAPPRPSIRPNPAKEFLDESLSGDDESLDLSQDEEALAGPPRVLADHSAHGAADSPFSGKRLAARETELEGDVASDSPAARAMTAGGAAARSGLANPKDLSREQGVAPLDDDALLDDDDDVDDETPLSMPGEEAPASPKLKVTRPEDREVSQVKLRGASEAKGLKGFCPVALKDERRLVEARKDLCCEHDGKLYHFCTAEALAAFQRSPSRYVPAAKGADVVKQAAGEHGVEGTLDRAVWYRGRLYLFASDESLEDFVEEPSRFATTD